MPLASPCSGGGFKVLGFRGSGFSLKGLGFRVSEVLGLRYQKSRG